MWGRSAAWIWVPHGLGLGSVKKVGVSHAELEVLWVPHGQGLGFLLWFRLVGGGWWGAGVRGQFRQHAETFTWSSLALELLRGSPASKSGKGGESRLWRNSEGHRGGGMEGDLSRMGREAGIAGGCNGQQWVLVASLGG